MNRKSAWAASCVLLGCLVGGGRAADQPEDYLVVKEGKVQLKDRLTLREEQAGFAGISGRKWVVEPDGQWRLIKIQPAGTGKVREDTLKTGQLTRDDLVALAKALAAQEVGQLPKEAGKREKANPHRIIITIGDSMTVLNGIATRRQTDESLRDIIKRSVLHGNEEDERVFDSCAAVAHAVESSTTFYRP